MSHLNHSETTHQALVERIPLQTGRSVHDWLRTLTDGPAFSRFEDKVAWLRSEHELPHGLATAIAHEADLARGARRL